MLAAVDAATPPSFSVLEMLRAADWIVIPLAAASIAGVTLIFYNLFTLRRGTVGGPTLAAQADTFLENEDWNGLMQWLAGRPEAAARILSSTITWLARHPSADSAAIRAVAEAEGGRIAAQLNQRATYVMDVGVLAPLLGLFGTVVGILRSFGSLSQETASPMRTLMLAGGVSQALIATAAGLTIGLACMAAYAYFRGRALDLVTQLESTTAQMVQSVIVSHQLQQQRGGAGIGAVSPAATRTGRLRIGTPPPA